MKKILFFVFINFAFKTLATTELELYYTSKIKDTNLATKIYNSVYNNSKKLNLDEKLVTAIMQVESNFDINAKSSKGAIGLMQLMPNTAKSLNVNPYIIEDNIYGGSKHIKDLLEKNNNNLALALASYNAGIGNVMKYRGIPPFEETKNYVIKVINIYSQLTSNAEENLQLNLKNIVFSENEFTDSDFEWGVKENEHNEIK